MIDNIKQPCESFILLSSIIHALRWINNIIRELEILHIPFKNVSYNEKRVFLFIQYSQLSQRRKLQIHFFFCFNPTFQWFDLGKSYFETEVIPSAWELVGFRKFVVIFEWSVEWYGKEGIVKQRVANVADTFN